MRNTISLLAAIGVALLIAGCFVPTRTTPLSEIANANLDSLQRKLDKATAERSPRASAIDTQLSDTIRREDDLAVLQAFADTHPNSKHAGQANEKINSTLGRRTSLEDLLGLQNRYLTGTLAQKAKDLVIRFVSTNTSLVSLQEASEKLSDPETKAAAEKKFTSLVRDSNDLGGLAQYLANAPDGKNAAAVKERVAELLATWAASSDGGKLEQLLAFALNSKWRDSALAASALKSSETLLQSQFEPIGEEDYKRNFSVEGQPAAEIVDTAKRDARFSVDEGSFFMVAQYGNATKSQYSRVPVSADGVKSDTLAIGGIRYERKVFGDGKTAREVITRDSPANKRLVRTETILFEGNRYRKSSIVTDEKYELLQARRSESGEHSPKAE